jgi:hypothetical protein
MLDHLHTLAHYVRLVTPEFEHTRDGELTVFRMAVEAERYWRLLARLQDFRDRIRRGSYLGTIHIDRPFSLERADVGLLHQLLDEHVVLGEMLNANEPMAVWTRPTNTVRGEPVAVRRYAYVPEEFRRRAEQMGIVEPELPVTRKRDMRRPGWSR